MNGFFSKIPQLTVAQWCFFPGGTGFGQGSGWLGGDNITWWATPAPWTSSGASSVAMPSFFSRRRSAAAMSDVRSRTAGK